MRIYCDSSTREACFIIEGRVAVVVPYDKQVTVNVGEYKAVILALEEAKRLGLEQVELFTDSQLIVGQITGVYECYAKHLLPFRATVKKLVQELQATIRWIPREENLAGKVLE